MSIFVSLDPHFGHVGIFSFNESIIASSTSERRESSTDNGAAIVCQMNSLVVNV